MNALEVVAASIVLVFIMLIIQIARLRSLLRAANQDVEYLGHVVDNLRKANEILRERR